MTLVFKQYSITMGVIEYTWLCKDCEEKVKKEGIRLNEQLVARWQGECYCCQEHWPCVKWRITTGVDDCDFNFNF